MIEISVIIATLNRLSHLEEAIQSIINQNIDSSSYEIIIVDSGTLGIETLAEKLKKHANVHFILQTKKGVSVQRNIGAAKAQGKYIAMIDDDIIAHPDWLYSYKAGMNLPNWGVLAGRAIPKWPENAKNYHKKSGFILTLYSMFDLGQEIKKVQYGFGCNLMIRKKAFEEFGGFDLKYGGSGKDRNIYREDVLLCEAIGSKYTNYYIPDAYVFHKVHPHRLKWNWLFKNAYARGFTKGFLNIKPKPYKKLKLSIYDYCLLMPYTFGFLKGRMTKTIN